MATSISLPADRVRARSRRWTLAARAGIAVGVLTGAIAASRSSAFDARAVEITGARHLERSQILRVADISTDTNALWLDEGAVERRLETMPWVRDARVGVAFPLTLEIRIEERTPVAIAVDGMGEVLMAADGTALGPPGADSLPRIEMVATGSVLGPAPSPVGAARALGALRPALRERVARVQVMLDGTLRIRFRGGPDVEFGAPEDAARKARAISRMLAWSRSQRVPIRTLSVVSPSAPAAVLAT